MPFQAWGVPFMTRRGQITYEYRAKFVVTYNRMSKRYLMRHDKWADSVHRHIDTGTLLLYRQHRYDDGIQCHVHDVQTIATTAGAP